MCCPEVVCEEGQQEEADCAPEEDGRLEHAEPDCPLALGGFLDHVARHRRLLERGGWGIVSLSKLTSNDFDRIERIG